MLELVQQVARAVGITDLTELFGELELARERVFVTWKRRQPHVAESG